MIEKRIGFNVAKLAREKGFKEIGNCYFGYTEDGKNSCNVMSSKFSLTKYPILDCNQTLLQKWIREVHGIFIYVDYEGRPHIKNKEGKTLTEVVKDGKYCGFEYEEALEMALYSALKLIKQMKK